MSWLSSLLIRFSWLSLIFGKAKPWIHWSPPAAIGFQCAHFFAGGYGVFVVGTVLHAHWLVAAGIVAALAAVKEFIVDIKIIEGDSYLSSFVDFSWYMVGILLTTHFIRHPLL